jgi:hypothetical protein
MSPPIDHISLFLFSNGRFSFHTTENIAGAGDTFKMAEGGDTEVAPESAWPSCF